MNAFRADNLLWHELDQIPTEQARDLIDQLESVLRLP